MLALKINIYNYFGGDHPEGVVELEKYYKIDKNMSVERFKITKEYLDNIIFKLMIGEIKLNRRNYKRGKNA